MSSIDTVGVVGAGTMGAGIAQLAATGGCQVYLLDTREGAAEQAKEAIAQQLAKRVAAGTLALTDRDHVLARLTPVVHLRELKACTVIIEAIAESLAAKRELFSQLEDLVSPDTVLASNTSSLSISAIGRDLKHRHRFLGMHFFNPVHAMKLVELVPGIDTSPPILDRVKELATAWGKVPVTANSTPGFIVNRIARPFYAEALMVIQERGASAKEIDTVMRGAGFRMGPCELMDLIGHDVNFAVTESMFRAYYSDRRFGPSILQQELVDAGRLGRKSGRGFYEYAGGAGFSPTESELDPPDAIDETLDAVIVHGKGVLADQLSRRFESAKVRVSRQLGGPIGLEFVIGDKLATPLRLTDGRVVGQTAISHPSKGQGVFDLPLGSDPHPALAVAFSHGVSVVERSRIKRALKVAGIAAIEVDDTPALIVARTVCMLINEAADAVQQGVCSIEAADVAMRLGVNYPAGPFEWLEILGTDLVITILQNLHDYYRGERYRISPWLQQRRWREIATAQESPYALA
jgi:3-hydroxybutyryl-CoA dehydrogenase